MAGDLLLTGLSALSTYRNALDTTGHNIANVDTTGYSRQSVEIDSRPAQLTSAGYVGAGVQTSTVTRAYDNFIADQFRSSSSATAELDTYYDLSTRVDGALADENVGLSGALESFFTALQTVVDDPTSVPARQALLTEGEVIENRFGTLDRLFDDVTAQVNGSLNDTVLDINELAKNIASLNEKIITATGVGGGNLPNDLLDQRDLLVDQLSEKVSVSTNVQDNGAMNVFIGSGQALVLNTNVNTLGLQAQGFDASAMDVVLEQPNGDLTVTQFMNGGEMGGILRFRDEVLDPAIGTLGQIAVAMSLTVNEQHKGGLDLNGAQGLDFFSAPSVNVVNLSGSSLGVTYASATDLTTSDYSLTTTGGNYTITRLSDNTVTGPAAFPGSGSVTVDGLIFDVSTLSNGESYRIRPTRDTAGEISLAITDPREIAAAGPLVSNVTPANTGSGDIANISVSNLETSTLPTSNITLSFNGTNYVATGSDLVGSVVPTNVGGDNYTLAAPNYGTINFTLTGNPSMGDTIVLATNAGGVGDNRNANLLGDLQTKLTLNGGTSSFKDTYGSIVADVGRRTQAAQANGNAQRGLLNQSIASRDSVSGVNLDEEAANLLRFQQAYQAASQVILTSRSIFDTLLGAFR
ncbi:MAG: flagellar hook-associated protein FlgK [Cycloclasticus sp.]|nr:flagellar hook-associated protein FlgK [Cycloclasticus sp.]